MNNILTTVLGVGGAVIAALCSWALERLINFLNKKIKRLRASESFIRAEDAVSAAVKSVYQTYVEGIKHTGEWTDDAKDNALELALENARSLLQKKDLRHIEYLCGDMDVWLVSAIESKIYDLKQLAADSEAQKN